MGIQGLLPLLKDIQTPINVSQYKGQTLGIDGYVWLHRGAYGCAEKIVMGEHTTQYTNYAMHRIRMLRHHGITPCVVFDGDRLPSKAGTEEERETRRSGSLARAKALVKDGSRASAFEAFAKCIDITPEMAYQLIKCLKAEGVPYVVAPYEADAQLAYLEKTGYIDAVVTEDSDLLVFGCRKVLFKMDSNGDCIEISSSRFTACKTLSFAGWTSDLFRQMAILSGCDYLPSISGMGLRNAHKLLQRYKTVRKVLQAIRLEGKMKIPPDYQAKFERAELTFLHQRVWCPRTERLTTLSALTADTAAMDYIGAEIPREVAKGIACGEIDPISRLPMIDIAKGFQPGSRKSAVASSSSSVFSRTISKDRMRPSVLPPGQTTLLAFGEHSTGSRANKSVSRSNILGQRQPLGARDINIVPASIGQNSPKKSPFFGGKGKPAGEAVRAANDEAKEEEYTTVLTKHPNATQSPISGIGDYFCELDGADPRLLMSGDEGEDVVAFAELRSRGERALVEGNREEDSEETFEWAQRDCASEVSSDEAGATPRKSKRWRETSSGSSALSSPCSEQGKASVSSDKTMAEGAMHDERINEQQASEESKSLFASPTEDAISSPVQGVEVDERDETSQSPESPSASRHKPTRPICRKRSLQEDHSGRVVGTRAIVEGTAKLDDEGDLSHSESSALSQAYYAHEASSRSNATVTPIRSRSVLRTPSNRPLRLYAYQTPAENIAFGRAHASAPGLESRDFSSTPSIKDVARLPVPPLKRTLSFREQGGKDAEDQVAAAETRFEGEAMTVTTSELTSGNKRTRIDSTGCAAPLSSTTSKSLSSLLPISATTPRPVGSREDSRDGVSPLAAIRYSEQCSKEVRKTALTLSTSPLPVAEHRGKPTRSVSLSATSCSDLKDPRQKQRGILRFATASTAFVQDKGSMTQGGGGSVSGTSGPRPSLLKFKYRSS